LLCTGKAFDTFAPIGPAIVTPDELGDAHKLGIRCVRNGVIVQNSNTDQLVFKTEDIIAWVGEVCSQGCSLDAKPQSMLATLSAFNTPH